MDTTRRTFLRFGSAGALTAAATASSPAAAQSFLKNFFGLGKATSIGSPVSGALAAKNIACKNTTKKSLADMVELLDEDVAVALRWFRENNSRRINKKRWSDADLDFDLQSLRSVKPHVKVVIQKHRDDSRSYQARVFERQLTAALGEDKFYQVLYDDTRHGDNEENGS